MKMGGMGLLKTEQRALAKEPLRAHSQSRSLCIRKGRWSQHLPLIGHIQYKIKNIIKFLKRTYIYINKKFIGEILGDS